LMVVLLSVAREKGHVKRRRRIRTVKEH
jgi:hypothetical protein